MRILIINSDAIYNKRLGQFIHKNTGLFLDQLKRKGLEPSLFHFFISSREDSSVTSYNLLNSGIEVHGVPKRSSKFLSYLFSSIRILQLFRRVKFVYCFYPNAFAYNLLLCKLMGVPYGLYLRGEKGIESKLSRYLFKNARFITTISPKFTDFVKGYNLSTYTIAPMIEFGTQDIVSEKIYIQKSSKISLLFIGRVERDKGIFELLKALRELKQKGIGNFILNVLGHGQHFERVESLIIEYKLQSEVFLRGTVSEKEEIRNYYNHADLFVLPTYHEGFPRVLYEAMIFRVPIVTTFVGSISHLMQDAFNCFKLEPKSVVSIVNVLSNILVNYDITARIAANGTKTIQDYLEENNQFHEQIISDNLL